MKDAIMEEKFWAQVDRRGEEECWPWLGAKTRHGYGRPMICGSRQMAHRLSLQFSTGQNPADLFALHSCDNPNCVNPRHLRWGTQVENIQDRVARKRNGAAFGAANGSCKLTVEQVRAIRSDPRMNKEIAIQYGITGATVAAIKCGKTWRWVDAVETGETWKTVVPGMQPHQKKQEGQMLKRVA